MQAERFSGHVLTDQRPLCQLSVGFEIQLHCFAEILALAGRCQLPANTVELLYQQRVSAEQQCAQVLSNPALSAEERRTLLLVIQSETRQQLFSALGETAGEAYLRHHGNWLEAMDR